MFLILKKIPKSIFLLISISIFVFILPFFKFPELMKLINAFAYSLITLSIFSIIDNKTKFLQYLIIIDIILIWLMYFYNLKIFEYIAFFFSVIIFIFTSFIMILQIVASKTVTAKVVVETISGYLLIGLIFGFLNSIILWINPNALNINPDNMSDIIYYSFTTITTIGYGDISPVSEGAKSLSILFGVISQLYLTIIIALIIGKFLNNTKSK